VNYLDRAREQVVVGDLRDDAVAALEASAWYYQPCHYGDLVEDLFFFGSHQYDKAQIVIVSSEPDEDVYRVYQVSSFESYTWHTAFGDCVDRTRFEE
jgi:hypothetical protein